MMVGDLVKYKKSTGWTRDKFGIIVSIINQWAVVVAWYGSDYKYMENIDVLEVVNEGW
tara:strand:- start:866 stop:1039 length:174 start_codon:yes stop_codon:yes gene_type:complete